jgi:nitrite transporter NirC
MYNEEITAVCGIARKKISLLSDNPVGYMLSAALAGIFVGFAVLLAASIGGWLRGNQFEPFTRILMGLTFSVALSLVVIAGAELFTGNNFVMIVGIVKKTVSPGECLKIWIASYLGNIIGSIILAVIFVWCGLAKDDTAVYISKLSAAKMDLTPFAMICRGVLCNILVCAAVWCSYRCKSEAAKLIIIFWCLTTFVATGYEHSIANMTLMTVGMLSEYASVSLGGWAYVVGLSTIGNIIGGVVFVALPYAVISRQK